MPSVFDASQMPKASLSSKSKVGKLAEGKMRDQCGINLLSLLIVAG